MEYDMKKCKCRNIGLVIITILSFLCPCITSTLNILIPKSTLHTSILRLRGGSSKNFSSNTISSRYPATITTPSSRYNSDSAQKTKSNYPNEEEIPNQNDITMSKEVINSFLSRENRNSFIVKVYSILTVQLLTTSLFIYGFHSIHNLSYWMMTKGRVIPLVSLFLSSICCAIMTNSVRARRSSPLKWQLLSLFTLGECISVGLISSFYPWVTVVSAMVATALATAGITLYTFLQRNSKYDLSQWGAALSSLGLIFIFYGLLHFLSVIGMIPHNIIPYNESIYCILGASLFSFYLAYHTRLIFSGKYNTKYELNQDDYVFGAVTLYSDIINIFIYILRILADDDDRKR